MYLCVRDVGFCLCDYSIGFWKCPDSVVPFSHYTDAVRPVICEGWQFTHMWKTLTSHHHFTKVYAHKTLASQHHFTKVYAHRTLASQHYFTKVYAHKTLASQHHFTKVYAHQTGLTD